jgi:hypothetical protein
MASTSAMGARPAAVLFKFTTSKDCQTALRRCKGLVGTKLGLDEGLMLVKLACKSELWPLFKEAKVAGERAY